MRQYNRRRYVHQATAERSRISDVEAMRRVLAAILTMDAEPSVFRRVVKSNWPSEFEHHAEAIKLAVFRGDLEDKKFRKLRAKDFDDVHLDWPSSDDAPLPKFRPTRAQIDDAMIAGGWFARLSIVNHQRFDPTTKQLVSNIDQFHIRIDQYRRGSSPTQLVDDQKILTWLAKGWSARSIGLRFGLSEKEIGDRIDEIAASLGVIANGDARISNAGERGQIGGARSRATA